MPTRLVAHALHARHHGSPPCAPLCPRTPKARPPARPHMRVTHVHTRADAAGLPVYGGRHLMLVLCRRLHAAVPGATPRVPARANRIATRFAVVLRRQGLPQRGRRVPEVGPVPRLAHRRARIDVHRAASRPPTPPTPVPRTSPWNAPLCRTAAPVWSAQRHARAGVLAANVRAVVGKRGGIVTALQLVPAARRAQVRDARPVHQRARVRARPAGSAAQLQHALHGPAAAELTRGALPCEPRRLKAGRCVHMPPPFRWPICNESPTLV
jgi:hypothetical protein